VPRLWLDPYEATRALKRGVTEAPTQVAERLARLVRGLPDERLAQLMRSPARLLVLEAIFWQMPRQLDRRRASGVRTSVRWQIRQGEDGPHDSYQLELENGRCRVLRGSAASEPRVTITVDGSEFLRIAVGASDPMRAYFNGRVAIAGDIMAAAKLASLFVIPGRPAAGRS